MSGGKACACQEREKKADERDWEWVDYKCNYSAFSGYHYTSSDWSSVRCRSCGAFWRTKANYPLSQSAERRP